MSMRWGLTVPLGGVPLADHAAVFPALADAGFTDAWTAEVAGTDAFTPLALAAAWEPRLRLGTAIAPVYTRGPGLLAMTAAALAETAPGRFQLGIGASSPVVAGDWNAADFVKPFARSRDMLRFLRAALSGELIDQEFPTFTVKRFRLERPPAVPPQILLAALRPQMLHLAAAEADGVILNWLSAADVHTALAETKAAGPDFAVATRIFVVPTDDAAYARAVGRRLITSYLTVPAYAAFHRWLGREEALTPMWRAWESGDRKGALASIPDSLVDELVVHGAPDEVRARVQAYADAGVTIPVMALLPTPELERGGLSALTSLISALGRGDS
ncbi:LLM class F420-dependent oxidoreductase [Actinoplanes regularis]|uniref:Probable F420-dependent oxidoreductase, Rv3093c family n=1 Tax=Actinoplanes regularis TaxID=52697 RepID=A0A238UZD9_9ACTN|nr:LLM class F420-dependent oxidoreductase [Actinoplanes regularis]GIE84157.1 LLM class F420-dependent oxidoreductase [Actinoplanes regularis]SNR27590.1 probable F420-dependent oxidoreductase, Rv3093c family [Actinoplanes regularis]